MDKRIFVLLLCVSVCCISLLTKAAAGKYGMDHELGRAVELNTIRKPSKSMIDYHDLILDQKMAQNKTDRLVILAEIQKANIWDSFKLIVQEMELAGSRGIEREELDNVEKKLNHTLYSDRSSTSSPRARSHYAKKYIEEEQKKADNTPERQFTLKFIQKICVSSIDKELLAMMHVAEEHGPDMKNYIIQEQRQAAQAEKDIKDQLIQFNIQFMARPKR